MSDLLEQNFETTVALARSDRGYALDGVKDSLRRLATMLGWANAKSSLGNAIQPGARVLIKPNLVLHENQGGWSLDAVVTHPSIIKAVVDAAIDSDASEVLVGDAPVQGCDFGSLLNATGLDAWSNGVRARETRFQGIEDFRRTTCEFVDGVRIPSENLQPTDSFVLFDLAEDSLLEPVTGDTAEFRVTCYDPRLLAKTHSRGRHQFLVARRVMEADVIINLPKLKTHKKAGVTCALKNLIGINGNKEYLPHHRLGGSASGGDCYPGGSVIKRALEFALDRQNQSSSFTSGRVWREVAQGLDRASGLAGDRLGVEGSWSGNDTIWRTCLDLNRILLYGRPDATLAERVQRRVIHLADAVIAGQGDGPLAPEPLDLGLMLASNNAAALDWIGASLLGYDSIRIPLCREAFSQFKWPLTKGDQSTIRVTGDLGNGRQSELLKRATADVRHPAGWVSAARDAEASPLEAKSNNESFHRSNAEAGGA
jgi:uncharacterized protein (DUF362 family)